MVELRGPGKETPLAEMDFVSVLAVAAYEYLEKEYCRCDEYDQACFYCEVMAAIQKAQAA